MPMNFIYLTQRIQPCVRSTAGYTHRKSDFLEFFYLIYVFYGKFFRAADS